MILKDLQARCILSCEAEAVAYGYSPKAGRDIYLGCLQDDIDKWDVTPNTFKKYPLSL